MTPRSLGLLLRGVRAGAVLAVCASVASPRAQGAPATAMLDRYLRGDFDGVATELAVTTDFGAVLSQLKSDGPAWIAAGGPAAREQRRLAAATFALEAARADEWREWKWREKPLPGVVGEYLYWKPPAELIEWGCALFREDEVPSAAEHLWQLAALTVAQRAEDPEFLIGAVGLPLPLGDRIEHLNHVRRRFPTEMRFQLGVAVALEWTTYPGVRAPQQARRAFEDLQDDQDVGAEALVRLGSLRSRLRDDDAAISAFDKARAKTRDPWLLYNAQFLKGQALVRKKRNGDAEMAFRAALAASPHAQSASAALAALLFKMDRRSDASDIVEQMFASASQSDPWREYIHADDRFWPELIRRLQAEIRR